MSSETELNTKSGESVRSREETWYEQHSRGWRFGILLGAILSSVVLIFNISTTAYSFSRNGEGAGKRLYEGDCDAAGKINAALHVAINALSTVLLSATNYAMQCLSAATRKEIDNAHQRGKWLDIGVLSVRNLRSISKMRVAMWALLGASSLPLHLLYNSAVYSTIYARDYTVFTVTEQMLASDASPSLGQDSLRKRHDPRSLRHAPRSLSISPASIPGFYAPAPAPAGGRSTTDYGDGSAFPTVPATVMHASANANNLTRLENRECIQVYSAPFQTSYRGLLLVTKNSLPDIPKAVQWRSHCVNKGGWMCGQECIPATVYAQGSSKLESPCPPPADPEHWKVQGFVVDHCLSEKLNQRCEVLVVPLFMAVVTAFNCFKVAILFYTFLFIKENPIMTIGDAIASFLENSDITTEGLCLMGKHDLGQWTLSRKFGQKSSPRRLARTKKRWFSTASRARWRSFIVLYASMLGILISLFCWGLGSVPAEKKTLMALGFGVVDPLAFISWDLPKEGASGLLLNAIVVNSPQPILSATYYVYNGIFTCYLLGSEWNNFATQRKGLRVSARPQGAQRTSYWLQLPKRWAIPLMALSGLLHWLVSRSLFLVSLITVSFASTENDDLESSGKRELFTAGYSLMAILTTIGVGFCMVLIAVVIGFRKHKNGYMPVAGTCSAAISAACHLEVWRASLKKCEIGSEAALLPLQWGVTMPPGVENIGHCSFSSRPVQIAGESLEGLYAGL